MNKLALLLLLTSCTTQQVVQHSVQKSVPITVHTALVVRKLNTNVVVWNKYIAWQFPHDITNCHYFAVLESTNHFKTWITNWWNPPSEYIIDVDKTIPEKEFRIMGVK